VLLKLYIRFYLHDVIVFVCPKIYLVEFKFIVISVHDVDVL
jgi:hypothetical protein